MNIGELNPQPNESESFRKDRLRFIPEASGCYALTTFEKNILYIGLAKNLKRRMKEHLGNDKKTSETVNGRAVVFYWMKAEEKNINKLERTWLNTHIHNEGKLPMLNNIYSPISV